MTDRFYLVLVLMFFVSGFLFISCIEDKPKEPLLVDTVQKLPESIKIETDINKIKSDEIKIKSNNIDSLRAVKEAEYLANLKLKEKKQEVYEEVAKEKNLSKEAMIEFLPVSLEGFKSLPPSTGRTVENDTSITISVRKQFIDDKRRTVLFDIFDYGRGNRVLNSQIYEKVPEDLDAPAYPIVLPNAKGFYYWLDQKFYGHIEVLADKRFVIMVRTNGFERNDKTLENYIKKINITKLINSGKK